MIQHLPKIIALLIALGSAATGLWMLFGPGPPLSYASLGSLNPHRPPLTAHGWLLVTAARDSGRARLQDMRQAISHDLPVLRERVQAVGIEPETLLMAATSFEEGQTPHRLTVHSNNVSRYIFPAHRKSYAARGFEAPWADGYRDPENSLMILSPSVAGLVPPWDGPRVDNTSPILTMTQAALVAVQDPYLLADVMVRPVDRDAHPDQKVFADWVLIGAAHTLDAEPMVVLVTTFRSGIPDILRADPRGTVRAMYGATPDQRLLDALDQEMPQTITVDLIEEGSPTPLMVARIHFDGGWGNIRLYRHLLEALEAGQLHIPSVL